MNSWFPQTACGRHVLVQVNWVHVHSHLAVVENVLLTESLLLHQEVVANTHWCSLFPWLDAGHCALVEHSWSQSVTLCYLQQATSCRCRQ